ncbi:DUF6351 family protein [Actinophytocola sediminis]
MPLVARLAGCLLAVCLLAAAAVLPASASPIGTELTVRSLSTRADLVTGGDVLVRVQVPRLIEPTQVTVTAGARDVTSAFQRTGNTLVGLVTGLATGRTTITATADRGRLSATLAVVNQPITGPILSGPHQTPFLCTTAEFRIPVVGVTLGSPLDANCSTQTRVDYVYRATSGVFRPLPDPRVRPADLARTTTNDGRAVNYVVRIETGTVNRSIYEIALLHDPVVDPAPGPLARPAGWNERLILSYGGGCRAGYHQGGGTVTFPPPGGTSPAVPSPLNHSWLAKGYAVGVASLMVLNNNCNDVVGAETTVMVKERFVERHGLPRHTIGFGPSGGSMLQYLIAQNYPGVFDGILPSSSFPDTLVQLTSSSDCALLLRAFAESTEPWTTAQRTAVAGWRSPEHCATPFSGDWGRAFLATSVTEATWAGCDLPRAMVYHPTSNPAGVRCTYQDNAVNVYGVDPATGFARRPLDNAGVQYGLDAFTSGTISAEQFVRLNELVGGYDLDGNLITGRTAGSVEAVTTAYRTGRVNSGANLDTIPIIDYRSYLDDRADPHDSVRGASMRARLIAANGTAANHVLLTTSPSATGAGNPTAVADEALRLIDQWLTAIEADQSDDPPQVKVVRNKPAGAVDACYPATGIRITDQAQCRLLYPMYENPRLAAGEPLANDVLMCARKPVAAADYAQPLTPPQLQRLTAVFQGGVCDYSVPGIGQQPPVGTWLRF